MSAATILRHGRALLQAAREDRGAWDELVPRRKSDDKGVVWDEHELDRLELAWALKYDARPEDTSLIRFVLEHEIAWRRQAPYQEIGEALEILAWLVARDRAVDDVWLIAQAKRANFDTHCGFDREHLFAAGVAVTVAHVRASHRPEREDVLDELLDDEDEPLCTEERVREWLSVRTRHFVTTPAAEYEECWIDRAIILGDLDVARVLLMEWWARRKMEERDFRRFTDYLVELGDYRAASDAYGVVVERTSDPFELAGVLCHWASIARRADRPHQALFVLEKAATMHRAETRWRELGLGRDLVLECFELAAAGESDISRRSFELAEEFARETTWLPRATLEAATRAARKVGAAEREEHYEHTCAAERDRIDIALKRRDET